MSGEFDDFEEEEEVKNKKRKKQKKNGNGNGKKCINTIGVDENDDFFNSLPVL